MEVYLHESSDEQTGIKHHIFLIILATTLQFGLVTAQIVALMQEFVTKVLCTICATFSSFKKLSVPGCSHCRE